LFKGRYDCIGYILQDEAAREKKEDTSKGTGKDRRFSPKVHVPVDGKYNRYQRHKITKY